MFRTETLTAAIRHKTRIRYYEFNLSCYWTRCLDISVLERGGTGKTQSSPLTDSPKLHSTNPSTKRWLARLCGPLQLARRNHR